MHKKSFIIAGIVVEAAVLLLAMSGCSLIRKRYTPRTLPPGLQAKEVKGAESIDISRIAGPLTTGDLIDGGDLLKVSVAAGLDPDAMIEFYAWVDDDGFARLPEIGRIRLAGLNLMQAGRQIAAVCVHRNLYRQPHVTVAMEKQRVNRVTVMGAVEKPGTQELPRGASYPLAAIMEAGGFSEKAGTKITIYRPAAPKRLARGGPTAGPAGVRPASATAEIPKREMQVVCLDLSDKSSRVGGDTYLPDGSTVKVESLKIDSVQVVGLVKKPMRIEFPVDSELDVFGAIAEAGGLSSGVADEVLVLRNLPDGQGRATIHISLNAAKKNDKENLLLAPGDIVSIERTPATVVLDTLKFIGIHVGATIPFF